MRRIITVLALAVVAACSSGEIAGPATSPAESDTSDTSSAPTGFPVTVSAANGEVTIPDEPQRIVSLAPTATETLFSVGAGEQVVAVDELSNYPVDAPVTDLSGFEPNVEAVVTYDPDLVVLTDDINDIVSALEEIGLSVIHIPAAADLEEAYAQIELLGKATGNSDMALDVVSEMRSEMERLANTVPEPEEPLTYYHELDSTLFTVTSATFIGQIYAMAGLENIADAAEDAGTSYPQLSAEFIIQADPDLIFLADTKCCGESAETVAARPGWDQLSAVTNGAVVPLDDDVASRWGPRVVDFFQVIVEAVRSLEGT